jgi:hypothetical protein
VIITSAPQVKCFWHFYCKSFNHSEASLSEDSELTEVVAQTNPDIQQAEETDDRNISRGNVGYTLQIANLLKLLK